MFRWTTSVSRQTRFRADQPALTIDGQTQTYAQLRARA